MNIIDYCIWRGDISFKKDPFNFVDNLCFAQLAYVPLDSFLNNNEAKTISELANEYFASEECQLLKASKSFVSDAPDILKAMAETHRFGVCKVYNYVSILHSETTEQFAAMMIDIPDGSTVVAFRGTDDSLVGWHEDLLLAYTTMPSQLDAVKYINKYLKPFHKYRILGHSKGGNLAIYASINCKRHIQKRIIQVISNDGPGLRPDTYSSENYKKLSSKYYKIVPQYDLFGTIYDNAKNKIIVKSINKDVLQHSGMSWQVCGNKFVTASDVDYISKQFKLGFDKFMAETTISQRGELIEEIFRELKKAGVSNISDFANGGLPIIIKTIKSMAEIKTEVRSTLNKLVKVFSDAQLESFNKTIYDSTEKLKNNVDKKIKSVEKKIKK